MYYGSASSQLVSNPLQQGAAFKFLSCIGRVSSNQNNTCDPLKIPIDISRMDVKLGVWPDNV
jgi:hypothetical protein